MLPAQLYEVVQLLAAAVVQVPACITNALMRAFRAQALVNSDLVRVRCSLPISIRVHLLAAAVAPVPASIAAIS